MCIYTHLYQTRTHVRMSSDSDAAIANRARNSIFKNRGSRRKMKSTIADYEDSHRLYYRDILSAEEKELDETCLCFMYMLKKSQDDCDRMHPEPGEFVSIRETVRRGRSFLGMVVDVEVDECTDMYGVVYIQQYTEVV